MARDAPISSKDKAPSRRDVLLRSPEIIGLIGTFAAAYPLFRSMKPRAEPRFDIKMDEIEPGQRIKLTHKGKPIVVRRLTPTELAEARDVALDDLRDTNARNANHPDAPALLANRLVRPDGDLIVMIGICTHLGCVPIEGSGDYGGWFCPCGGSHYDTVGRIRKGPAMENMSIPVVTHIGENTIRIG